MRSFFMKRVDQETTHVKIDFRARLSHLLKKAKFYPPILPRLDA
jgi:hypothetical protein